MHAAFFRFAPYLLLLCWSLRAGATTVSLGFEGCPPVIFGEPGEVITIEVFATLTTAGSASSDGAQAWQISLAAEGGIIRSIALEGVEVSTIYDEDGDPASPPIDPYLFDLGGADYAIHQLATHPLDGRKGAISAVIPRQTQKMVLQPNGLTRLARLTVEVTVPPEGEAAPLTLRFEDGFKGTGLPVKNSIILDGQNTWPSLGSCTTVVQEGPQAALALEGCPEEIRGKRGEVKSFEAVATLTTSGNPLADGARSWQIGLAARGGVVRSVSLEGLTVETVHDHDGDPATPPVRPFLFELTGAALAESGAAARPADGAAGAVSRVVLGTENRTALLPEGTARLARFTVEVTIPPAPGELKLEFLDGLTGSGDPVTNLAEFDLGAVYPSLGSCVVRLEVDVPTEVLPGDCDHDGTLDISDGICLLEYLFLEGRARPCETGPGNLSLVDGNGDATLDLSDGIGVFNYLFLGGRPHVLGEACTVIAGCPPACP